MLEQAFAMGLAEWLAVLLAVGYLLLAVQQNPWCWACGAGSAAIYLVIFARTGLQMQSLLQAFYIAMSAYGWHSWRGGGEHASAGRGVSRWPLSRHLIAVLLVLAVSIANGYLLGTGQGLVSYVDAFVAWGSVLATWMVARKLIENWLYWIVFDTIAAGLYWSQGLRPTTLLFVLYAAIALRGYLVWRRDMREAETAATVRAHA